MDTVEKAKLVFTGCLIATTVGIMAYLGVLTCRKYKEVKR